MVNSNYDQENAFDYIRTLLNGEIPRWLPRPDSEEWAKTLQRVHNTCVSAHGDQEKFRYALLDLCKSFELLRPLFPPQQSRRGYKSQVEIGTPGNERVILLPDEVIFPFDRVVHDDTPSPARELAYQQPAKVPTAPLVAPMQPMEQNTLQPAVQEVIKKHLTGALVDATSSPSQPMPQSEELHNTTAVNEMVDQKRSTQPAVNEQPAFVLTGEQRAYLFDKLGKTFSQEVMELALKELEDEIAQTMAREPFDNRSVMKKGDARRLTAQKAIAINKRLEEERNGKQSTTKEATKAQPTPTTGVGPIVAPTATKSRRKVILEARGTRLSDVEPKEIPWIWKPRLALGKLVMLDGAPGQGKSSLLIDIGSRFTKGLPMPDGSAGIQGGVILISSEDGLEDTIVPRFMGADADRSLVTDLSNISFVNPETEEVEDERPFSLVKDLPVLEEEIKRINAKLVIIDPLMDIMIGVDIYKETEVREALKPLKLLVQACGVTCVMVRHFTKNSISSPMNRGGGSIAFNSVARMGFIVAPVPGDPTLYALAQHKSNNGEHASTLTYRIVTAKLPNGMESSRVEWGEEIDLTAEQLLAAQSSGEQQSEPKMGKTRQQILEVLSTCTEEGIHLTDIQAKLPEITADTVRKTLNRMVDDGHIVRNTRGHYAPHS